MILWPLPLLPSSGQKSDLFNVAKGQTDVFACPRPPVRFILPQIYQRFSWTFLSHSRFSEDKTFPFWTLSEFSPSATIWPKRHLYPQVTVPPNPASGCSCFFPSVHQSGVSVSNPNRARASTSLAPHYSDTPDQKGSSLRANVGTVNLKTRDYFIITSDAFYLNNRQTRRSPRDVCARFRGITSTDGFSFRDVDVFHHYRLVLKIKACSSRHNSSATTQSSRCTRFS